LHDVGVAMGLVDPSGQTGAWEGFGQVLSVVASAGVSVLADKFKEVTGWIKDAASIFRGFKEMIEGFAIGTITGDWSMAWLGLKRTVLTVVGDVLQYVGKLVQGVAAGIDAMGLSAGQHLGATEKVKGFIENLNKDLDKEKQLTIPGDKKAKEKTSLLAAGTGLALSYLDPSMIAGLTKGGREMTDATRQGSLAQAAVQGAAAMGGLGGLAGVAGVGGLNAARTAGRINVAAPNVQVQVVLDGQQIAGHVTKTIKENKHRGGGDEAPDDN
jgi:hypothetical protein